MRLDLRFSNRPLEDIWCQAVTALVFHSPNTTMGVLFGLNNKMAGALDSASESGVWTGDRGENFLIATQHTIRADKLLFHGLGPMEQFNYEVLEEAISALGTALDKIGISEFGINIPMAEGVKTKYSSCLELSASNLVKVFLKNHRDDPDFILKIIFSIEKDFMNILDSVVSRLREHFKPIQDLSIIIDKPTHKPTEAEESEI